MDKLDKFLRSKLDQKEYPYREAYWKDMESRLSPMETGKRRGGMLWWWAGLAIVLLGIAYLWIDLNGDRATLDIDQHQPAVEKQGIPHANLEENLKGEDELQSYAQSENSSQETRNAGTTGNTASTRETGARMEDSPTPENETRTSRIPPGHTQDQIAKSGNVSVEPIEKQITTRLEKSKLPATTENAPLALNSNVLAMLPLSGPGVMEYTQSSLHLIPGNIQASMPSPARGNSYVAIAVKAFGYVPTGSSSLSHDPGYGGGVEIQKPVAQRFALNLGIGAHVQYGGLHFSKQSEQIELGFSATQQVNSLQLTRLYQAYADLSIDYLLRDHVFTIGAAAHYGYAGKGQIRSTIRQGFNGMEVKTENDAWINLEGIRKVQPEFFLAYGRRIQPAGVKLQVGLHVQQQDLLKENAVVNLQNAYQFSGSKFRLYPRLAVEFELKKLKLK